MLGFRSKKKEVNENLLSADDFDKIMQVLRGLEKETVALIGLEDERLVEALVEKVKPEGSFYAIDNRFDPVDLVEKKYPKADHEYLETLISSEISIPLEDEVIDTVVIFDFIRRLRRSVRFIFEIKRILKKNGRLLLVEKDGKTLTIFKKKKGTASAAFPSAVAFRQLKKASFAQIQKRVWENQFYSILARRK